MDYFNIKEEELKNKVAKDFFWQYDCTSIIGNVDFCVRMFQNKQELFEQESLLWAEAKKGSSDIYKSLVQLILTIGKARTFDKHLPPAFLGAFDSDKIAFVPYNEIHDVFYLNDFNWNVTPSNYDTKEFKFVHEKVKSIIDSKALLFTYEQDEKDLIKFIKNNFIVGRFGITKTKIDKNNFMVIYNKWLQNVKPTIAVNWEIAKKTGIIDGDFYLADLLSLENETLKEKLFVLLKKDHYELDRKIDESGMFSSKSTSFNDGQTAHNQFWNKYDRPPKEEYWDYIVERRDLLVPQDVRERKGSFFTPQIWVELSQKYLTDVLGEDWQDDYYIWDCAAGTGNLLNGLTNKYNIWASTLDKQDVEVMKDRIKNGANLLEEHVFQFDFLNDDFDKLPKPLYEIINNPEKRKKLVIYINPPYAEATTAKTVTGTGENKSGVANQNKSNEIYKSKIGNASNEIFALFMARIIDKMPESFLAQFSTLKFIQGTNFINFKNYFQAKFMKGFIVPANTFDNVKGSFPIGFTIWDLKIKEKITNISCDIYNKEEKYIGLKNFYGELPQSINKWIKKFDNKIENGIGYIENPAPDFQNNKFLCLTVRYGTRHVNYYNLCAVNIIEGVIYFSVRHCIEATWLNDRDQFLFPNDGWKEDKEFQNDCLAFTLFHGQNKITSKEGTNHWLPFTESEVNAKEKFGSNFMTNFIKGKIKREAEEENLFTIDNTPDFIDNTPNPSTRGEEENSPLLEGTQGVFSNNSPLLEGTKGVFSNNSPLSDETKGVFSNISPLSDETKGVFSNNSPLSDETQGVFSNNNQLKYYNKYIPKWYELPYNKKLTERAKELRKSGNIAEVKFWEQVKNKKYLGLDFDRQKIVGNFIVDFYCKDLGFVVEIDGSSHNDKIEYDFERDNYLKGLGLIVYHFTFSDVMNNLNGILKFLEDEIIKMRTILQGKNKDYVTTDNTPDFIDNTPDPSTRGEEENSPLLEGTQGVFSNNSPLLEGTQGVFSNNNQLNKENEKLIFSAEAEAVFDAGRELWKYYHSQTFPSTGGVDGKARRGGYNVNASLYDIREYFQGRNENGKMNNKSEDEKYMNLIGNLRDKLKILARKIEPKVYEYGFLKE